MAPEPIIAHLLQRKDLHGRPFPCHCVQALAKTPASPVEISPAAPWAQPPQQVKGIAPPCWLQFAAGLQVLWVAIGALPMAPGAGAGFPFSSTTAANHWV
jgi:hypothetical protein